MVWVISNQKLIVWSLVIKMTLGILSIAGMLYSDLSTALSLSLSLVWCGVCVWVGSCSGPGSLVGVGIGWVSGVAAMVALGQGGSCVCGYGVECG